MNTQELTVKLYQAVNAEERDKRDEHWHASTIAQCPRANYFARKGVPSVAEASGAMKLRWATGHALEGVVRPYLKSIYPNLVSNVRFTNEELDLTGEVDNYDPDSKTIIEVKSVHPNAVRYKKVGEDRYHLKDDKQYLHHEYQQHAYVLLMSHPQTITEKYEGWNHSHTVKGWEVERIIYLYVSLSGLIVTYDTPVKPEILANVKKRVDILNQAWRSGEVPPCLCEESHPLYKGQMRYCPYKTDNDCCNLRQVKEDK